MLNALRLDADRAMLLVIDVQEKLVPLIDAHDEVVASIGQLLRGVRVFELPVLATEQYPKGIGSTIEPVAKLLGEVGAAVLSKATFSCCGDEPFREALRRMDRPEVILCGIEAHVCVQQTALDLLSMDYQVFVCADAVGSRRGLDLDLGLARVQQAGAAVTTVEAVLFELCERCDSPRFKQLLEIIKSG
ncbi:MAG: hydrolase [Phycisphaerae bacterium]